MVQDAIPSRSIKLFWVAGCVNWICHHSKRSVYLSIFSNTALNLAFSFIWFATLQSKPLTILISRWYVLLQNMRRWQWYMKMLFIPSVNIVCIWNFYWLFTMKLIKIFIHVEEVKSIPCTADFYMDFCILYQP